MDVVKVLKEWADVLHIKNFGWDFVREMAWWFIKTIANLCDYLNNAVTKIYELIGFSNSSFIKNFMENINPLYTGIATISVMFLGFWLLTKREDSRGSIWQNLIIIIIIITSMSTVTAKFADLTLAGSNLVNSKYASTSAAFATIDDNVIDLLYVDGKTKSNTFSQYKNYKNADGKKINKVENMASMKRLNITDYMDYDDGDLVHDDLWKARLSTDKNGEYTETKMNKTWIDYFHDYYYRYHVNWFNIILSLCSMALVLFFTCFKAGRIVVDIAIHQVFAAFIALTDLVSGQRIKELIRSFLSLFAALFLISVLLGIYFMGLKYLSSVYSKGTIDSFVYVLMQVVLAYAVIDGPSFIEKILGTDIGMQSGLALAVGATRAASGASHVASGVAGGIGAFVMGTPKAVSNVGSKVGEAVIGKEGMKDAKEKVDGVKDKAEDKVNDITGGKGMVGAAKNVFSKSEDNKDMPTDKATPNNDVTKTTDSSSVKTPGKNTSIDQGGVEKIIKGKDNLSKAEDKTNFTQPSGKLRNKDKTKE